MLGVVELEILFDVVGIKFVLVVNGRVLDVVGVRLDGIILEEVGVVIF